MKAPTAVRPRSQGVPEEPPQTGNESAIEQQIAVFLAGQDDGNALFSALYGTIAEEPVPQHLLALVRRPRRLPKGWTAAILPFPGARRSMSARRATRLR